MTVCLFLFYTLFPNNLVTNIVFPGKQDIYLENGLCLHALIWRRKWVAGVHHGDSLCEENSYCWRPLVLSAGAVAVCKSWLQQLISKRLFFFTAFKFLRVYSPFHTPFNKPTQKPLCLIMHVLFINPLLSSRGTQRYSLVFSLFFVFENHTCAFCLESKAFAIVLNYIDITNVVITHSNLHFFQHLSF